MGGGASYLLINLGRDLGEVDEREGGSRLIVMDNILFAKGSFLMNFHQARTRTDSEMGSSYVTDIPKRATYLLVSGHLPFWFAKSGKKRSLE